MMSIFSRGFRGRARSAAAERLPPGLEGKEVRKGQVLFEIDPEPYQAALDQRRADLARARARLALAERDAARAERLIEARAISQEEMDWRYGGRNGGSGRRNEKARLTEVVSDLRVAPPGLEPGLS